MNSIVIAGQKLMLTPLSQKGTKDLWVGLTTAFQLRQFAFQGHQIILLISKGDNNYSPLQRYKIVQRLEMALELPCAFYFDTLPTRERDRLVEQGVYFIVSDKFAFIPSLLANRRIGKESIKSTFLPATQYILLYHLQAQDTNGLTLKELSAILPYQYSTIAKSVQQLCAVGLATYNTATHSDNQLHFVANRAQLWEMAQPMLSSPVLKVYYTSEPITTGKIGGISALSQYSMLVPETVPTRVMTSEEIKEYSINGTIAQPYEDTQRIEIWKYPPIAEHSEHVDRLSLYLTLKNDTDPRVEKELETMLKSIQW